MMNNKLTTAELEYIISRVIKNADEAAKDTDGSEFQDGRKLAYYEILDTIKNELEVRDIDTKQFGLDLVLEKLL